MAHSGRRSKHYRRELGYLLSWPVDIDHEVAIGIYNAELDSIVLCHEHTVVDLATFYTCSLAGRPIVGGSASV